MAVNQAMDDGCLYRSSTVGLCLFRRFSDIVTDFRKPVVFGAERNKSKPQRRKKGGGVQIWVRPAFSKALFKLEIGDCHIQADRAVYFNLFRYWLLKSI